MKQDKGYGIQGTGMSIEKVQGVLNPESRILDPASLERIRWRCRRGLLELDIVLERFIGQYATLDTQQKIIFDELLDLPDTRLWELLSGKETALNEDQRALIALINLA